MFFEDFCNEGMAKHLQITISSFLNVCIDVLDVASVFHREIFDSFYYKVTGKILIARDPLFVRLEGQYWKKRLMSPSSQRSGLTLSRKCARPHSTSRGGGILVLRLQTIPFQTWLGEGILIFFNFQRFLSEGISNLRSPES